MAIVNVIFADGSLAFYEDAGFELVRGWVEITHGQRGDLIAFPARTVKSVSEVNSPGPVLG